MNEDFELGITDMPGEVPPAPPKKTKAAPAVPKAAPAAPVKQIDPEDDRANWPTIHIEMEADKPNYEFLLASGTKKDGSPFHHELQVMRGVDVQVPPSVVYALRDAVAAHYVQRRDPTTGRNHLIRMDRSAIPWRLIKAGKYCA